jgi:hypothetical protein
MRVCPLSKIYPEQSTITEFISHLSCPAPDPQPITPPGVLPTQAPSACSCSRSSTPNGEGSPTARPSAEKRKREKMWRSTTLTSSAIPSPRPGLGATRARRGRGGTGFDYRREGQGFEIAYVRPSSALTPVTAGLRLVAGARRAIPRRIHGVRLAFTSGARSDRSIAVRGPGVALTPVPPRPILRAGRGARPPTAARCRAPRSSTLPRSSKPVLEPTTRSRTVPEMRMSDAGLAKNPRRDMYCDPPMPRATSPPVTNPVWISCALIAQMELLAATRTEFGFTSSGWRLPLR